MTYELPKELEPESQRLWIMGGTTGNLENRSIPKEMIVMSFNNQRKPTPLRLLAMEWVVENTSKNDKGLMDLPRDLREELKSRRSWMGKQRFFE